MPVLNVDVGLDATTAQPVAFAAELLRVGGIGQDFRVFQEATDENQRMAVRFDARDFPTGRYRYSMMVDSQYPQSAVGSEVSGTVLVDNQINSAIGAGWRLNATSRLIETRGEPLFMDRSGALLRFNRFESGGARLFPSAERFAAGDNPESIAIADLDGDGAADLVTANSRSNDVGVLLGNGDGTFQAAQPQPVARGGNDPRSVAIADLDGDGAADLVTANSASDDVSVLLGNGDGTFQAAQAFAAGDAPLSVAIADLDGDGAADLVTANSSSTTSASC